MTAAVSGGTETGAVPKSTGLSRPFAAVRARWQSTLIVSATEDASDPDVNAAIAAVSRAAQRTLDSLATTAGRTALWSDLPQAADDPGQASSSYSRVRQMALAYAIPGSALFHEAQLGEAITGAMDWLAANAYNARKPKIGNWWYWEIGIPLSLNDAALLVYDRLTPQQLATSMAASAFFTPSVKMTGANLVWIATIIAIRGSLVEDAAQLAAARDGLSAVFPYVQQGDGFYADGSFIQHGAHPYNGGYGAALLANLSPLLSALAGSPWAVTDPNMRNVYDWVANAFSPLIVKGAMMDMVRGREVSRTGSPDHATGQNVLQSVLLLAQEAPAAEAETLQRWVKREIEADTYRTFLRTSPAPAVALAKRLLSKASLTAMPELVTHRCYAGMDRVVHRRPGWSMGISMSSQRIFTYESINHENLHGWYTGDGMTTLYTDDLAQFGEGYWPTVNPYRLPGTTVAVTPRADSSGANYRSPNPWTGGAVLGDRYGVAGMDLQAWADLVRARKSWFLFDDEVVALGAGISSAGGDRVETILENRRIVGSDAGALTVDGSIQPTHVGWTAALTNPQYLHLQGVGGYVPLARSVVQALREQRTAAWTDINKLYTSATPITNTFVTLWLDHGAHPDNAGYAYALLPTASAAQTASFAARPPVVVLANTAEVQALRHTGLKILAATFWTAGPKTVDFLTCDSPAAVLVQDTGGGTTLDLAIADPTQQHVGTIRIELARPASKVLSADHRVSIERLAPTVRLSVNVAQAQGLSIAARLAL